VIDQYDWAGGREAMPRFGSADGPVVLVAMPLFEEANRTRAFVVTLLRALAGRGIGGALPDLPGQGESIVPTEQATLEDWRSAYAAAADALRNPLYSISIRGGSLIDCKLAMPRWQFAPVAGSALVREMIRARTLAAREDGGTFDKADLVPPGPPVELSGNRLSRDLLAALEAAEPGTADRTIRLATDPADADCKVEAAALWRRAEPDNDPALAALLADDIAAWVRACGG
jgi:hypothetical protein